uniref:TIL domain-containing protein n=1 Tax=Glossina palpalis gambiensis TaxID=67801 RepID=A0A1B0AME3_9MUSC
MFKLNLILIVLIALATLINLSRAAVIPNYCEDRQVYLKCGPSCPARCRPYTHEECPAICIEGCFCKKRYVINARQQCVDRLTC